MSENTSVHYRPEIDGLRAVAVIPVILFHAGFSLFSAGYVGVDVFFVVSGYLITSIILSEKKAGTFSISKFYERRARRILPALFLVIFASSICAWFLLLPGDFQEFSKSLIAAPAFVSNILFWKGTGYFGAGVTPLLHTWSLAVEEQFYLLYPVFFLLTWRIGIRWIVTILLVIFFLSLGLAEWASKYHPTAGFFLLPTRGWELAAGAFTAFYLIEGTPDRDALKSHILSVGGLMLIAIAVFGFGDKYTQWPSLYTLVPVSGTVLVILFASSRNAGGALLSAKPFVVIGLISYSAYLWHHPLFEFSKIINIDNSSFILCSLLVILTFILAYFSWKYVETPFRRKDKMSRREVFVFSLSASLIFLLFGIAGLQTGGFINRFSEADRHLAVTNARANSNYAEVRFKSLELTVFDRNDRRLKVVLIGDSYAKDLANAVCESELNNYLQLSTFFISSTQGNLYLEEDLSKFIAPENLAAYSRDERFDHKELRLRMKESDLIWLASNWKGWQAKLVPKSLKNLENDFGEKVFIFGKKNFGEINLRKLLSMSVSERQEYVNPISPRHVEINALMKETLPDRKFIDISFLLCGNKSECKLFTDDGRLISWDGGHLTKEGSRFLGRRILENFISTGFLTK